MGPWSPPSHSSILCPGPLGRAWWTVVSAPAPAHLVGCWDPSRHLPCRAHFALSMPSRASLSWWRMMCPAWPSVPGAHTRHSLPPLCRAPSVLPLCLRCSSHSLCRVSWTTYRLLLFMMLSYSDLIVQWVFLFSEYQPYLIDVRSLYCVWGTISSVVKLVNLLSL